MPRKSCASSVPSRATRRTALGRGFSRRLRRLRGPARRSQELSMSWQSLQFIRLMISGRRHQKPAWRRFSGPGSLRRPSGSRGGFRYSRGLPKQPRCGMAAMLQPTQTRSEGRRIQRQTRWRKDSDGFGHGVSRKVDECFQLRCWVSPLPGPLLKARTLPISSGCSGSLPDARSSDVWELIDQCGATPTSRTEPGCGTGSGMSGCATGLRNSGRIPRSERTSSALSRRTRCWHPSDPVLKHRWLFCDLQWFDDHDVSLKAILGCDQPAASAVGTAIAEIHSHAGINGILRLASSVDGQGLIACHVASLDLGVSELNDLVRPTVEGEFRGTWRRIGSGVAG